MARELRFPLQTGTVIITNGAIPAPLRLQKLNTTSGRVVCVSQWMRPDSLVTKTYTKYRKELGENWVIHLQINRCDFVRGTRQLKVLLR